MADLYPQHENPGDMLLRDWIAYVTKSLGQEQWFTAYCSLHGTWGTAVCFCAWIPNAIVPVLPRYLEYLGISAMFGLGGCFG